MVPHARNPFFAGREDILTDIRSTLISSTATALTQPAALSGLGGIGKTQTVVEYAYRHQDKYQTILWVNAENETNLQEGFVEIAQQLGLPEAQQADLSCAVAAVRDWLQRNEGWLLILDNADEPALLTSFLPAQRPGHILLTSRARNFAMLHIEAPLDLPVMSPDEAISFLLHRTKREQADPDERAAAVALAGELGYLPLALEQAAAYIVANQSRFQDYLSSYRRRAIDLLERRGPETGGYHKTVAVTWSLNFEAVTAASEASAHLLHISAFLAPDRIPEELLVLGASGLGQPLAVALVGAWEDRLLMDELLEPLARYSLIVRNVEHRTYNIHRLVQAVIMHDLGETACQTYAAQIITAVSQGSQVIKPSHWIYCDRLLPHQRACSEHITRYKIWSAEAVHLLNQAGFYLQLRAQYKAAKPFYEAALAIAKQSLGQEHLGTARAYSNLGGLLFAEGNYSRALALQQQALLINQKIQGLDHPDTATSLNNIGSIYLTQGKYSESEPLYERALAIRKQSLGGDHPDTAVSLNNLASLYFSQGKYSKAESLYETSLAIRERSSGHDHPDTATGLNNLAKIYLAQGKYSEAEPLYLRALSISGESLGYDHPDTAESLNGLVILYKVRGENLRALPLQQRALEINEDKLGPDHPNLVHGLINLATIFRLLGNYDQARPLYNRATKIVEQSLGSEHPDMAICIEELGAFYDCQDSFTEALSLYQRALKIREKVLKPSHPLIALSLSNIAGVYLVQHEYALALPLYMRVLAIREKALGADHLDTAYTLSNLACIYHYHLRASRRALALYERATRIFDQYLGPDHPITKSNRAHEAASLAKINQIRIDKPSRRNT